MTTRRKGLLSSQKVFVNSENHWRKKKVLCLLISLYSQCSCFIHHKTKRKTGFGGYGGAFDCGS